MNTIDIYSIQLMKGRSEKTTGIHVFVYVLICVRGVPARSDKYHKAILVFLMLISCALSAI